MGYNLIKMQKKLKKYVDEARVIVHTLGVMYTAAALAMRYDADLEKAQVAGLLHDCAKCIPNDKKLKLCQPERYSRCRQWRKNHRFCSMLCLALTLRGQNMM